MHDRRQVGVAIVEDVGAGGVEERRTQRIDPLAPADHGRLPAAGEFRQRLQRQLATGSVRQPASATAKKFSSARLASWRALGGDVLPLRVDDEAGESLGGSGSGLHGREMRHGSEVVAYFPVVPTRAEKSPRFSEATSGGTFSQRFAAIR